MLQRIKATLDNSVLWLLFLVGCVAYFWRKEKDAEYKLAEEKAAGKVKDDEEAQSQADHAASNADDEYQRLRDAYLRAGHTGVRQGSDGKTGAD